MDIDDMTNLNCVVRFAVADEIMRLRWEVLRAGIPIEAARFDGDDHHQTVHIGAFLPAGDCVGCCTLMPSMWNNTPACHLRGMATAPNARGQRVGRRLLEYACAGVQAAGTARLIWANARCSALGFYTKFGWSIESDEFDIPTAGPHRKVLLDLRRGDGRQLLRV